MMRDPDLTGLGRGWHWEIPEAERGKPENAAHVDSWFINGPWHPLWNWWVVMCVDLIDRPGLPPANLEHRGAEFEILILSISPDWQPDPDAKPGAVPYLTPADLQYQFEGITREAAKEITGLMVKAITEKGVSPDSDMRGWWQRSLDSTLEHYKAGMHG